MSKRRRTRRSLRVARAKDRRARGAQLFFNWLMKTCYADLTRRAVNSVRTAYRASYGTARSVWGEGDAS